MLLIRLHNGRARDNYKQMLDFYYKIPYKDERYLRDVIEI